MRKTEEKFFLAMIDLGLFVGLSFTILSYILGVYLSLLSFELTTWMFSLGLAIISLSFAAISIFISDKSMEISKNSSKIAKESDKRVNSIANDNFLRVTGELEDRRIEMNFPMNFVQFHRINTWKCLTYIKEANKLLDSCRIEKDNIDRLTDLFEKFMGTIKRVEDVTIEKKFMTEEKVIKTEAKKLEIACEELSHILTMYHYFFKLEEKVRGFISDYTINKETKENAIKHVREIMKESKKKKIDLEYVEDKKNKLSELIRKNKDIKNRPYLEILDKLK